MIHLDRHLPTIDVQRMRHEPFSRSHGANLAIRAESYHKHHMNVIQQTPK
jgi:hypothetical protein